MASKVVRGDYDVVIVGGGPSGLQAAMLLARMQRPTLVLDSNRPRHSATLAAHAFLTRDNTPPNELRALGRESVEHYEHGEVQFGEVTSIERIEGEDASDGYRFRITSKPVRGTAPCEVRAKAVLITAGISERLPEVENLRAFYGTTIHSCLACDAWDHRGKRIALFGFPGAPRLAERAVLLSRWTDDLVLLADEVTVPEHQAAELRERGIEVDRRRVVEALGGREGLTGLRVVDADGAVGVVECSAAFVRPDYETRLAFAEQLGLARTNHGLIMVDDEGRASVEGIYAAGETAPPGPQMLIMAAGSGAHAAVTINRDLLGLPPDTRRIRREE